MSDNLRTDLDNLAARMPHRGGITENERHAAEYIRGRLEESSPFAQIEDFYSVDGYPYLFAMYYAEFFFVAVIALWFPWVMFGYGLAVFLLYMAEFTGYSVLSRFLPQYETQNVSARYPCATPKRLLVVSANYDSPKDTPWTRESMLPRLRWIHAGLVCAMVLVVASCAAQGLGLFEEAPVRIDLIIRWAAVTMLSAAGVGLYVGARGSEFTPGANNNASGVSVLLALADRLHARPLENTEVWVVATGSKELWLSGMRSFFRGLKVDKPSTYFLNVTSVGSGPPRFVTGEGMLAVYKSAPEWLEVARECAGEYRARPMVYHGPPTDALIPLARGHKAMSVTGAVEGESLAARYAEEDRVGRIDLNALENTADFVEDLVRRLDARES